MNCCKSNMNLIWIMNNELFEYALFDSDPYIRLRMIQYHFILSSLLWIRTNGLVQIHYSSDMWSGFGHCFPLPHTQELWRRLWISNTFTPNSKASSIHPFPEKSSIFALIFLPSKPSFLISESLEKPFSGQVMPKVLNNVSWMNWNSSSGANLAVGLSKLRLEKE